MPAKRTHPWAIWIWAVPLMLASCAKSSHPAVNPSSSSDTILTDTSIFIDVTIQGQRTLGIYHDVEGVSIWYNLWGPIIPDSTIFRYDRVGTTFLRADSLSQPSFSFSIGNFNLYPEHQSGTPIVALPLYLVDSFFVPGNLGYAVVQGDTSFDHVGDTITYYGRTITLTHLSPGVTISWKDSTGIWETINGVADQSGSYFTIQEIIPDTAGEYAPSMTITAAFACKLYDGKGHMIQLTHGRFRQKIWI